MSEWKLYKFSILWPSNERPFRTIYENKFQDDNSANRYAQSLQDLGYLVTQLDLVEKTP